MNVLFFASLREQLDSAEETFSSTDGIETAGCVLELLIKRGEPWASALNNQNLIVSVNQEVSDWTTPVKLGDEVAIFPPVTGG